MTMCRFDEYRATVLGWFPPILTAAQNRNLTESAARLAVAQERLRDGRLTAVVCGEFKRGKSSLLNALLEEPDFFPTDTLFATSIVSTVTYGATECITAILESDGTVEQREIGRGEIESYVTESGNPHNARRARAITITTPNPKLKSGLTLVDTPGVGGVYAAHTAVTLGFLPSADAIVFVTDVTQPLTEGELDFLRQAAASAKVTDDEDGLLFVLTKIDLVDYTSILNNTRAKLAEVTGRPAASVLVTPVSSRAKLDYLCGGDAEDLELSNFPALEERIWGALSRRRTTVLLGGALGELDSSVQALLEPLRSEQRALREQIPGKVAQMQAQAADREAEFARLGSAEGEWRDELRQRLNDCRQELMHTAQAQIEEIWDVVDDDYLNQSMYLEDPRKLVKKVTDRAVLVMGETTELAARRVARIQQDLADKSGLAIEQRRFGDLPPPPVHHRDLTGLLEPAPRGQVLRLTRDSLVEAGLGATIGGTIGSFVLPGIGTMIGSWLGAVVGGGVGYQAAAEATRKQEIKDRSQSLKTELAPLKRTQLHHVEQAVDALMSEFCRAVTAELGSRITQARQSAQDQADRLIRAGRQTRQETDHRLVELDQEIPPLVRLGADIAAMVAEITRG